MKYAVRELIMSTIMSMGLVVNLEPISVKTSAVKPKSTTGKESMNPWLLEKGYTLSVFV